MVTNGNLSKEDYSLSCIVCGSQERVALLSHRASDKVVGIFCFCEKCWPEYAGATLRTEWIKDAGEVSPKEVAEALITSTNNARDKTERRCRTCIDRGVCNWIQEECDFPEYRHWRSASPVA